MWLTGAVGVGGGAGRHLDALSCWSSSVHSIAVIASRLPSPA